MVQVLQKVPGFAEQMGHGVGKLAGEAIGSYFGGRLKGGADLEQYKDQNSIYKQLTGRNLSKDPNIAKLEIEYALRGEEQEKQRQHEIQKLGIEEETKSKKSAAELQEKLAPFMSGLETINQMRNIKNKGNLGFGSEYTGLFSPETRKDRAMYSQLGKSLISLASTVPIRNQQEFQTLAENLYNPSATEAELEGTLYAMENIIKRSMQQYQMGGEGFSQTPPQAPPGIKKERRDILSFHE